MKESMGRAFGDLLGEEGPQNGNLGAKPPEA